MRKNKFCFKFQGSGAAGFIGLQPFQVGSGTASFRLQGCFAVFQVSGFKFFRPVNELDFNEAMNLEMDLFRLRLSL